MQLRAQYRALPGPGRVGGEKPAKRANQTRCGPRGVTSSSSGGGGALEREHSAELRRVAVGAVQWADAAAVAVL